MKHLRSESGQSLIELAVLLPILLTLTLGVFDFALIYNTYVGIVNAANVGATYAATSPAAASNLSAITAAALGESNVWRCTSQPAVTRTPSLDPYGFSMISVTVSCQVDNLIAIPAVFNNITVSAKAVRRVRPA